MGFNQDLIDEERDEDAAEKKYGIYFGIQKELLKLADPNVTNEEVHEWIKRKDSRLRLAR